MSRRRDNSSSNKRSGVGNVKEHRLLVLRSYESLLGEEVSVHYRRGYHIFGFCSKFKRGLNRAFRLKCSDILSADGFHPMPATSVTSDNTSNSQRTTHESM